MLKVGGIWVSPIEVENALIAHPAVLETAVVGAMDQDELVKPMYGRKLAAALPHARLEMVHGGHMAPYTHPYAIAAAVRSLAG